MRFKGAHNKFFHANKIPVVGFEMQIAETQREACIFYFIDLFYIFYLLSIYILLTDPSLFGSVNRTLLHTRRQKACDKLFKHILEDPNHKLNDLIPRTDVSINYQLRNDRKIHVPNFCTERFKNTYIIASCLILNQ